ncbi:MAG: hypothetical protein H6719_20695 [Sandaracinaceae bacterium]|nr:hypothetical protein [Sandaracinaceae bacterium]
MPFVLTIREVEYLRGDAWIDGRIVSGAFSGPEAVTLFDEEGTERHAVVVSHGLENPVRWPVQAGDATLVRLTIPWPGEVAVDATQPVRGDGVVLRAPAHVDVTSELTEPLFWATELGVFLPPLDEDSDVELVEQLFGVASKDTNPYYRATFDARWRAGVWPRIRASIGLGERYVEYEAAAGIEYQSRFWIGDEGTGEHVLLGYQSGHFSTPALRVEELYGLAERWRGTPYVHLPLLLATVTYDAVPSGERDRFLELVTTELPGLDPARRPDLVEAVTHMMGPSGVTWRREPDRGWVNDGPYSQRNPEGSMSLLGPEDFAFIERFFAEA